jgi:GNAT superfamily N-acetyltransferase
LTGPVESVLDNPVWTALTGPHQRFAELDGSAVRYQTEVAPFLAIAESTAAAWDDVRALTGPGGTATVLGEGLSTPGWEVVHEIPGVQMVEDDVIGSPAAEAVPLTAADVPEMLDLVTRTRPGPFLPRTIELGTYLGIRRAGQLVAMAGERLRPPGWTEISAVCTDPSVRGEGLATRLVLALVAGISARGERAFLHAAADNTGAIRLYESLGFRLRAKPTIVTLRVPAGDVPGHSGGRVVGLGRDRLDPHVA